MSTQLKVTPPKKLCLQSSVGDFYFWSR